ncbi:hypothetical protein [Haloplanus salinarum]|uniref:hypothetical protein n=1 Tax=Haloplanus salinarum TaxID=1912324 RepID=UPI00214AE53C|nr:hypothetical protein [Haloplanus salinarum]
MTIVQTEAPLAEETSRHLDMLGRDLGALEALRDPAVRREVFAPIAALATAVVFAYATMQPGTSTGGALLGAAIVGVTGTVAVKWADQAVCVLRAGHTCHSCSKESDRWEVSE